MKKINIFPFYLNSLRNISLEELTKDITKYILILIIPVIGVYFYYVYMIRKKLLKPFLLMIYLIYSLLLFFSVSWYAESNMQLFINLLLANMLIYHTDYVGFLYILETNNKNHNKVKLFLSIVIFAGLCLFSTYLYFDYSLALFLSFFTIAKVTFAIVLYLAVWTERNETQQ